MEHLNISNWIIAQMDNVEKHTRLIDWESLNTEYSPILLLLKISAVVCLFCSVVNVSHWVWKKLGPRGGDIND